MSATTIGPSGELYESTIPGVPEKDFKPAIDAEAIRKALEADDLTAFMKIVTTRSYVQRKEIAKEFIATSGQDIKDFLKAKLSGNFEKTSIWLFTSPGLLMGQRIQKAMKGSGTDEKALSQVICSASNKEITQMKSDYKEAFGKDLIEDVKNEISGAYEKILVALLQGNRNEPTKEDMEKFKKIGVSAFIDKKAAEDLAVKLYQAGEGCTGTDEDTFISILCKQSVWQVAAIDVEYKKKYKKTISEVIKKEFSRPTSDALVIAVKACLNRPKVFAELIFQTLDGIGTDDDSLISLIVARSSIDLGSIKKIYPNVAKGVGLLYDVRNDTTGIYEELLAAIIKE